jgi:hypothetical protein
LSFHSGHAMMYYYLYELRLWAIVMMYFFISTSLDLRFWTVAMMLFFV